jgi:hypothetical protein
MDYLLNVRHCLHNLHEVLVASFREVRAWCLPFPTRNAPIENYIDWFEEEVRVVSGIVWQLNDNFVILAIEGIEAIPAEVQKVAGRLVRRWCKNHGLPENLHRLEAGNTEMVSDANAFDIRASFCNAELLLWCFR